MSAPYPTPPVTTADQPEPPLEVITDAWDVLTAEDEATPSGVDDRLAAAQAARESGQAEWSYGE